MSIRKDQIRGGLFLLLLLGLCLPSLKAQTTTEIGGIIQSLNSNNSWFQSTENPLNELNLRSRTNNTTVNLFLQKNREKVYHRFLLGYSGNLRFNGNRAFTPLGELNEDRNERRISTSLGFEMGKNIDLGKGFRLQAGWRTSLGTRFADETIITTGVRGDSGTVIGYQELDQRLPVSLSLYGGVAFRLDYQFSKVFRAGFSWDWGVSMAMRTGKQKTTVTSYDLNGNVQSTSDSDPRYSEFSLNLFRPLTPGFLLGFSLGTGKD